MSTELRIGDQVRLMSGGPASGVVADVAQALTAYMLTIKHLQRTVNDEEWATHGDWATLERNAEAALEKLDEAIGK